MNKFAFTFSFLKPPLWEGLEGLFTFSFLKVPFVRGFRGVLILLLLFPGVIIASDIISATPKDGIGKQVASIHSFSGQTKPDEGAFNLLYNTSDGESSRKKWVNNSSLYPWVVFELTDIYEIDKITFRDVKLFEPVKGNIPQYRIEVSLEHPDNCMWEEVALKKRQGGFNVKELVFDNPVKARYVKFTAWRGETLEGKFDEDIRIYGLDIYGTVSEKIDRQSISVGKTILGFKNATAYYERPLHMLDGNTTSIDNRWKFSRPTSTDSLNWAVIDLEKSYLVDCFKLYDARTLEKLIPNLKGYNIYVSTEAPDISKIEKNEDKNTCWTQLVDAYAGDRSEENIKTDNVAPTVARYVKLEIPRSVTLGYTCIFQFEVFGEDLPNSIKPFGQDNNFVISPNPVRRDNYINIKQSGILQIYSLHGVLLKEHILSGESNEISTANLAAGVYIVRLSNQGSSMSAKLIVE